MVLVWFLIESTSSLFNYLLITDSFKYSCIHCIIHSFIPSCIPLFYSFNHSFFPSFIRSFIHSITYSFVHSDSFIHLFIHSFIHSFIQFVCSLSPISQCFVRNLWDVVTLQVWRTLYLQLMISWNRKNDKQKRTIPNTTSKIITKIIKFLRQHW